ncbi:hypothetical protein [Microbacterium sp. GXF6406]
MTTRQVRLVRGAAASTGATVIAAVSHTFGGGAAPHPLLVVALSVFLIPMCAVLVGRRLRLRNLALTVLLSQALFHMLFVALNATAGSGTDGGHQHALVLGPVDDLATAETGMLGAHLLAAAVTTALLWRGERLLRLIAGWVRAALRHRALAPFGDFPASARPIPAPSCPAHSRHHQDISRRGPPAVLPRG